MELEKKKGGKKHFKELLHCAEKSNVSCSNTMCQSIKMLTEFSI